MPPGSLTEWGSAFLCCQQGFHNGQDHQLAAQLQPQLTGLGRYLRDKLSHSRAAQKALLGVTLLLMAMVLGDGVLTPSISGLCVCVSSALAPCKVQLCTEAVEQ